MSPRVEAARCSRKQGLFSDFFCTRSVAGPYHLYDLVSGVWILMRLWLIADDCGARAQCRINVALTKGKQKPTLNIVCSRRIAWGPNPQSLGPCRITFCLLLIVEVFLARTLQASATIDLLSSCHTFKELGKVSNMWPNNFVHRNPGSRWSDLHWLPFLSSWLAHKVLLTARVHHKSVKVPRPGNVKIRAKLSDCQWAD